MAKRDVELIIRAKDEASRALSSIAAELDALRGRQDGASTSSKGLGASLVQAASQMAKFEQVTGLVVAASDRAEAALTRQRKGIADTASQLAAVNSQMNAARATIAKQQTAIVDSRLAGRNPATQAEGLSGTTAITRLQASIQAVAQLEAQQSKLTATLNAQRAALGSQEGQFRELASMVNSAESAVESFSAELKAETAATDEAVRAQARLNSARGRSGAQRLVAGQRSVDPALLADTSLDQVLSRTRSTNAAAAKESAAASQASAAAARSESAALQALLDRVNPLALIQRQLAKDIDLARAAMQRGAITAKQFAQAEAELTRQSKAAEDTISRIGKGASGKPSLFGLKPYELTNLGYQVNDVITQVASGTPLMQVFAQQGGQILQLLPGIGGTITAVFKNPYILAAAAALGLFAAGLSRASDNAARLRKVEGLLAGIADGAKVSTVELVKTVKAIEQLGIKSEEALKITRALLLEGFDPAQIKAYVKVAQTAASVTGTDLASAAKDMTTAFSGGYQQVAALDDALAFLTVTEREEIRALFDSGRATEARTRALQIYQGKMRDVATESAGIWATSVASLEKGFDRLLDRLADTAPIKAFANAMTNLVGDFGTALSDINDLTDAQIDREIALLKASRERAAAGAGGASAAQRDNQVKSYDKAIARLEAAKKKLNEPLRAPGETAGQQKKLDADYRRERDLRNRQENGRTRAARIEAAGQIAYNEALNRGLSTSVALEDKRLAIKKAQAAEDKKAATESRKSRKETITLQSPVSGNHRVSSGFDLARRNPVTGKVSPHPAIDIPLPVGTPVRAAAGGRIKTIGNQPDGGGKYIVIDHGGGTETTLMHLSENEIFKEGDIVRQGDVVGKSGGAQGAPGSGLSTGPHLDFRVKTGGKFVDPRTVLGKPIAGSPGEAAADAANDAEKAAEQREEAQADFNRELDQEIERRAAATAEMKKQSVLSGEALLDAEREAAVAEAVQQRAQQAADKGVVFDERRKTALEAAVRAEFDLEHARERATAAIDDNSAERDALLARIELAKAAGDSTAVGALERELVKVDKRLLDAIAKAEKLQRLLGADNPAARANLLNLETQGAKVKQDAADRERAGLEARLGSAESRRGPLREQIGFFKEQGQSGIVAQLTDELRLLDAEYVSAIDHLIEWLRAYGGPEAEAAIASLQNLRNEVIAAQNEFALTGGQIRDAFAGSLTDSFKLFAERLVETKDVLGSLGTAVLSFAATFIEKLAEMALQAVALKAASKLGFGGIADGLNGALGLGGGQSATQLIAASASLSGSGAILATAAGLWQAVAIQLQIAAAALAASGVASGASGAASGIGALAGLFHEGGVAGMATRRVGVNPAWFSNAVRYHSGGIAGLKPDEVPAILRRGEEVLTTADRRHRANDNGGGSGVGSISQVLAIGDDEIAGAMAGAAGDRVHMTWLRRNRETVRQVLNG